MLRFRLWTLHVYPVISPVSLFWEVLINIDILACLEDIDLNA